MPNPTNPIPKWIPTAQNIQDRNTQSSQKSGSQNTQDRNNKTKQKINSALTLKKPKKSWKLHKFFIDSLIMMFNIIVSYYKLPYACHEALVVRQRLFH